MKLLSAKQARSYRYIFLPSAELISVLLRGKSFCRYSVAASFIVFFNSHLYSCVKCVSVGGVL